MNNILITIIINSIFKKKIIIITLSPGLCGLYMKKNMLMWPVAEKLSRTTSSLNDQHATCSMLQGLKCYVVAFSAIHHMKPPLAAKITAKWPHNTVAR